MIVFGPCSKLVMYRKEYVESLGRPKTNDSPKGNRQATSVAPQSSPTRSKGHPPVSSSEDPSGTSGVIRRDKGAEINSLRDNRYSLQVNPNSLSDPYRPQFGSLPRRSAPAPPNKRDSVPKSTATYSPERRDSNPKLSPNKRNSLSNVSGKPPPHPSTQGVLPYNSPQSSTSSQRGTGYPREANLAGITTFSPSNSEQNFANSPSRRYSTSTTRYSPQTLSPTALHQRRFSEDSSSPQLSGAENSRGHRRTGDIMSSQSWSSSRETESLQSAQPPQLPSTFAPTDGSELVEQVRSRASISYRKTLVAVEGVLDFLKDKVPACAEMVDGLLKTVRESQVSHKTSVRELSNVIYSVQIM